MELLFISGALFIFGLILVIKGGDAFVDAAQFIASITGIPKIIIGATIVSLATTLPELIVSLLAVSQGSVNMAIGNAVGSVACNVGLIMGISIIVNPAFISRLEIYEKGILMVMSTAMLLAFSINGRITMLESIVLIFLLVWFIFGNIRSVRRLDMKRANSTTKKSSYNRDDMISNIIKFILGALGIVIGAKLLVDNGTSLAKIAGVPESIIGITLLAIGTSLPELITTIIALKKNEPAMSIGNILGANIIDITLILSSCTIVSGAALPVSAQNTTVDIPITLILMLIAVIPTIIKGKFYRMQGFILVSTYIAYIFYSINIL